MWQFLQTRGASGSGRAPRRLAVIPGWRQRGAASCRCMCGSHLPTEELPASRVSARNERGEAELLSSAFVAGVCRGPPGGCAGGGRHRPHGCTPTLAGAPPGHTALGSERTPPLPAPLPSAGGNTILLVKEQRAPEWASGWRGHGGGARSNLPIPHPGSGGGTPPGESVQVPLKHYPEDEPLRPLLPGL